MNQPNEKYLFRYSITKSLELISNEWLSVQEKKGSLPKIETNEKRPLVILLTWLGSKRSHAYKFVEVYLEKGFDVLLITTTPFQMLLPIAGILVSSSNLADFLYENHNYQPIVVHTLSIGSAVWLFAEKKMARNREKYQGTIDRVTGVIWDSPPNGDIASALSYLIFKKDSALRMIVQQLIHAGLIMTYFIFCKYIEDARCLLYDPLLKLPHLLLISKDDPITPYNFNMKLYQGWKAKGFQAYVKAWEKSVHVAHFLYHRKEYIDQVNTFLLSVKFDHAHKQ